MNRFDRGIVFGIECRASGNSELGVYNKRGNEIGQGYVGLRPGETVYVTDNHGTFAVIRDLRKGWSKRRSKGGYFNHLDADTIEKAVMLDSREIVNSVNLKDDPSPDDQYDLGQSTVVVKWSES